MFGAIFHSHCLFSLFLIDGGDSDMCCLGPILAYGSSRLFEDGWSALQKDSTQGCSLYVFLPSQAGTSVSPLMSVKLEPYTLQRTV